MFDVKKNLKGDMDAARLLNISEEDSFYNAHKNRVSNNQKLMQLNNGIFKPYRISSEVS